MDLLMTTSHTRQWHKQNNVINPAHYKISYYEWIQKSGGKVWYHTNLEVDGKVWIIYFDSGTQIEHSNRRSNTV